MSGITFALISGATGGGSSVTLTTTNVDAQGAGAQTASYRVGNNGTIYSGIGGSYTAQYSWTGEPRADFEVRATVTSGVNPTGDSLATWLGCGTTRTWTVTSSAVDNLKYSILTVEVRLAATGTVLATGSAELYAERTS